jgi:hypothetical protein
MGNDVMIRVRNFATVAPAWSTEQDFCRIEAIGWTELIELATPRYQSIQGLDNQPCEGISGFQRIFFDSFSQSAGYINDDLLCFVRTLLGDGNFFHGALHDKKAAALKYRLSFSGSKAY